MLVSASPICKSQAPEQMFCAPRPANPYQIDGHSYSAISNLSPAVDVAHSAGGGDVM